MPPNRVVLVPLAILGSLSVGYGFGAWSFANDIWPIRPLRDAKRAALGQKPIPSGFDQYGRLIYRADAPEIQCPSQDSRTAVILFIGQSIQSNSAGQRARSDHGDHVVGWFNGHCAIATSPLAGSTGAMGEALTPLGNQLVASGVFDKVVLAPSAIGGSAIARWARGGDLNAMLSTTLARLGDQFRPTHVIWHQGEDDFSAGLSGEDYERRFLSMVETIRASGAAAPIFVSVATRCDDDSKWRPDNPVANAQRRLPDPARGLFAGVDTDALLSPDDRYDGCHLGASGVEKYAGALAKVLANFERARSR